MNKRDIGTLRKSKEWSIWIKSIRKGLMDNRREFAERIGYSPTYVTRFEKSWWVPSFHACERIAARLGMDKWEVLAAAGYAEAKAA